MTSHISDSLRKPDRATLASGPHTVQVSHQTGAERTAGFVGTASPRSSVV